MDGTLLQPGVEIQNFYSKTIKQELMLFIKLPFEYKNENESYPTLYCLDGNYYFPFYSTPSLIFEAPWYDAEKIIIVGIGYKLDDDRMKGLAQIIAWRTRDLTPIARVEVDEYWKNLINTVFQEDVEVQTGGAEKFLKSIVNEVIPFIETHYRADSQERGLAGYSLGGLFTLYTLFQKSESFQKYSVGSPPIWQVLFDYEERFAESHQDLNAKVYMSVGEYETSFHKSFNQMKARLESRTYPGLALKTHIFEDEDHTSCVAPSISDALKWLYYS